MTTTTSDHIDIETAAEELRDQAMRSGDHHTAHICEAVIDGGARLHDSEGRVELDCEDLGITIRAYVELVHESLSAREAEGHVRTTEGRRVYASL